MELLKRVVGTLILFGCPLLVQAAGGSPGLTKLLRSADPGLQTEWGLRYEHGEGVARDYPTAVRLYCRAAKRGDATAQYQLGWLYANGRGVDRDDALAAAWFRRAAARGDAHARRMLELVGDTGSKKRARCVVPNTVEDLDGTDTGLRVARGSTPARRKIEKWVHQLAPRYGLDPDLVLLVIEAESAFRAHAVSPKNAQGLMQLIPATARRFGVGDVMDPLQNLHGGMAYLRWLLVFFEGDVRLALAGYNAGENAVEKYRGVPPYPETRSYVARIVRAYGRASHPPVTGMLAPVSFESAVAETRDVLPDPDYTPEPKFSLTESPAARSAP